MPADELSGWRRNAAIFLAGQTVSLLGSMLVMYAVMWHLTIETRSGSVLMLSLVFGMLPQAFMSIFGGVWADRHHRKFLIMGSDATIAVATLILAGLMASGIDDLWVIYLALAIRSTFAGIQMPAVTAMIPQIVPESQLLRINGAFQTIQSAMALIAPALAAVIYASMDIVAVFFIDAVTALIGVGLLALVPVARLVRPDEGQVSYFGDLRAGLKYVSTHAHVRWILVLFTLVMVMVGAPSYLTPLMVTRTFGDEVWKLTANELFWGFGMLAGGVAMATFGPKIVHRMRLMVGSVVFIGLFVVGLGVSTNMWLFFVFGLLIGFLFSALSAPAMTILQERVEPEMQGRVFGIVGIVMSVAMPLSMVVFGPLADQFSVESLLVLAGLLLFLVVAGILAIPGARRSLAEVDVPKEPPIAPADPITPGEEASQGTK